MSNKLNNKKICFLGVTFKAGTDDMRESPSLKIIPYLIRKGCKVRYYDPSGPKSNFKNNNIKYCPSTKDACVGADLLIVHTEWNEFKQLNFKTLVKKKIFSIFDLRNLYSPLKMKKSSLNYFSIGR